MHALIGSAPMHAAASPRLPQRAQCRQTERSLKIASSGTAMAASSPQSITSVAQIADRYKGILLDQFGVLHDGRVPYPGAIEAVRSMHASGLRILIISNSSRRSGGTIGRLEAMGFQAEWFSGAVTSGELTHRCLSTRPTPFWQGLGRRCLHFNWGDRGAISLDDLNLEVVTDPWDAEFIVAHGTEAVSRPGCAPAAVSLAEINELLAEALEEEGNRPPMIVANPDLVTVDGSSLRTMPGTLARAYSRLGGEVVLMGKPAAIIYEAAAEMLALPKDQILAIGDSLEHDIAGANRAGVDSLFVIGGIHAAEVPTCEVTSEPRDRAALQKLCDSHQAAPTYLQWRLAV